MDFSFIEQIAQYGIFALLFVSLFVWTLKSSEKREKALQETLNKFADIIKNKLNSISSDLEEVKEDVEEIKSRNE
jgi:hypothetical protein